MDTSTWRFFPQRVDRRASITSVSRWKISQKMADSALEAGAQQGPRDLPRDGRFAEVFIKDPAGQRVDLSKQGWKT